MVVYVRSCDVITGLVRLYFNGMLIGSKNLAPNLKVPERVVIGGDEYQKSFHGKVAGLEIYHCVLPEAEIARKFQAFQNDPTFLGTKGKNKELSRNGRVLILFFSLSAG